MSDLFHSEIFWIAVAGVIFVALVYKKIGNAAGSRLDARSEDIRKELDDALALKEEAKKFLADARQKQKNAEEKAKKIILHAREESVRIVEESKQKADESIALRQKSADDKIAAYEAAAMADIRRNLLGLAIDAVRDKAKEDLNNSDEDPYFDSAVSAISSKLH